MSSTTWLAGTASGLSLLFTFQVATFQVALAAADRPDPQTRIVEEIAAKVNGKIITRGELDKQRERIQAEFEKQGLTGTALQDAVNRTFADALKEQIDQLLLVAKGEELSINVEADVTRRETSAS